MRENETELIDLSLPDRDERFIKGLPSVDGTRRTLQLNLPDPRFLRRPVSQIARVHASRRQDNFRRQENWRVGNSRSA